MRPCIDYNELAESRIKFGRYHYIAYLFINFVNLSDGSEMLCLSLILPILQNEWQISMQTQKLLGTILFLGIMAGSMCSGYFSDNYGRRYTLLRSIFAQFCTGVISWMATGVYTLMFARTLFGFTVGITIPITSVIISEITPTRIRGLATAILSLGFTIGSLYGCLIALLTLDTLSSGNWRLMLLLGSLPGLVAWFGLWLFVSESPRYEISRGHVEQAVSIMNRVGYMNDPEFRQIRLAEVQEGLQNWSQKTFNEQERANISIVFSPKNRLMTICLLVLKFGMDFVLYGMTFIAPYILDKSGGSGLTNITITYLAEFPSLFLALAAVEYKYLGRKNSLFISMVMCLLAVLLSIVAFESQLVFALSASRFFLKIGQTIFWPLISESYPTTYRSMAVGVISGFGRFGAVIMPTICLTLYSIQPQAPLYAFGVVSFAAAVACYYIPFDGLGHHLDTKTEAPEPEALELIQMDTSAKSETINRRLVEP